MSDNNFEFRKSYVAGLKDGITKYAWWKDGVQYVGTCGTTLKMAFQRIDEEFPDVKGQGWDE